MAKELKDRYKNRRDGNPRIIIDTVVLNTMYNTNPYDIARGTFNGVPGYRLDFNLLKREYRVHATPQHVQLCVINRACIKSMQEVETNGH